MAETIEERKARMLAAREKTAEVKDSESIITEKHIEFDHTLLPSSVAPFVRDVADRMNKAPISFAGASALVVLSAAIGRRVSVRPKLYDDWTVVPNLWGMLIAPPSIKKSPIYNSFLKPLFKLEKEANDKFVKELGDYASEMMVYEIELKAYKDALKKGEGEKSVPTPPEKPTRERYVVNDATIEKVAEIMIENPFGLLLTLDELSGWFASLSKAGREGDRSFWLEAFNGNGSKNIDRIGRGSTFVPHVCSSIFGTIQPDSLSGLILSTKGGGSGGDGLLQRFQIMVMETETGSEYVDRQPNGVARDDYYKLVEDMANADPVEFGAKKDNYNEEEVYYRFSTPANQVFQDWSSKLNKKIIEESEINPALASHFGKYEGMFASLALILFYADRVSGITAENTIPKEYAVKAEKLCDFFEYHSRKIYDIERLKEEKMDAQSEKILNKVQELNTAKRLPMSYSEISQQVYGTSTRDVEDALKGSVVIEGRKVFGFR